MSSACTLVCPSKDFSVALGTIREILSGALDIQGSFESWQRIEVHLPQSVMIFTSLIREKPGDQFSKLILSMHNFFHQIETPAIANKNFVLECVADAEMLIGIIVDPEFREEEKHFDCIWSLAERLNAVVFSGEAMLNAQGARLLNQTGETDVQL